MAPQNQPSTYSQLWGKVGEEFEPAGRLIDWSYAGYAGGPSGLLAGIEGALRLVRLELA